MTRINFYLSDNSFTQALLVMLVTNIISAAVRIQAKKILLSEFSMKKIFATEEPWMLVCDTSTVILSLV